MNFPKKKVTFNVNESTHQGLKLLAAARNREMTELVEEALGTYFEWNRMTKIEKDQLKVYRYVDRFGSGNFNAFCQSLQPTDNKQVAELLDYLDGQGLLKVEVNDDRTGFKSLDSFPDRIQCVYRTTGALKMSLTVPGRQQFELLQARENWEKQRCIPEESIQKAAAFRLARIAALQDHRSFVPLAPGPKAVLHFIPEEAVSSKIVHDVRGVGILPMHSSSLQGWGMRINLDGIMCVAAGEPSYAYTEIYRTGTIEAVRVGGPLSSTRYPSVIPSELFEKAIVDYVSLCFEVMRKLGCKPPIVFGLSMLDVKGFQLFGSNGVIDRDSLVFPEVVVEDLTARPDPILKPIFDMVWNACGEPESPFFDGSGNWVGQQRSMV